MFCGKCGAEVLDGAKFCDKCGAIIEVEQVSLKQKEEKADVKSAFIDPDEELVAKIGNGYLINLLYDKVEKCNMLLTNKRVYLKGSIYTISEKSIMKKTEERILDVEDVTGTGFIYNSISWGLIILDVILTIISVYLVAYITYYSLNPGNGLNLILHPTVILTGIILLVAIYKSRKTFFFIDYAGGRIMINAKLIGVEDVRDFHKQMRRVKDNIKGKIS